MIVDLSHVDVLHHVMDGHQDTNVQQEVHQSVQHAILVLHLLGYLQQQLQEEPLGQQLEALQGGLHQRLLPLIVMLCLQMEFIGEMRDLTSFTFI